MPFCPLGDPQHAREQEKIVVPPQEPLTAKNLAEAITVLTAAAKESTANLRAEGFYRR